MQQDKNEVICKPMFTNIERHIKFLMQDLGMVLEKWDDKYNVKTVSAKLTPLDFVKFKTHCDAKGITPSKEIKNLIEH